MTSKTFLWIPSLLILLTLVLMTYFSFRDWKITRRYVILWNSETYKVIDQLKPISVQEFQYYEDWKSRFQYCMVIKESYSRGGNIELKFYYNKSIERSHSHYSIYTLYLYTHCWIFSRLFFPYFYLLQNVSVVAYPPSSDAFDFPETFLNLRKVFQPSILEDPREPHWNQMHQKKVD